MQLYGSIAGGQMAQQIMDGLFCSPSFFMFASVFRI